MDKRDKRDNKPVSRGIKDLFGGRGVSGSGMADAHTQERVVSGPASVAEANAEGERIAAPQTDVTSVAKAGGKGSRMQKSDKTAASSKRFSFPIIKPAGGWKASYNRFKENGRRKAKFPGFKILDGYITRKFLGTYIFAILLIVVVIVVFDAVEKMDDFITNKAPLTAVAIDYYLNFVPYFVNQFSGLFTFIAVIFFTSKMAYQTEIIAILSSGVSFKRLMWPYLLSALLIAMVSLALNLWIIPNASGRRVEFERQYFTKNVNPKYERHIYRQTYPGTFAYIRGYNGKTEKAAYLAIEQYEGSRMVASLEAADVAFDPETRRWMADRYITRAFDSLNVEKLEKLTNLDTMINLDAVELGKLEDVVQTMNIGKLNKFIREQKDKGSDMISMFEVERQNRFAYPMATFVLTVIGLSLSSRKVRGGTGLHIGIGIALCFTYIMFCRFAAEFAKSSTFFSPTLLVWTPNIIYAFIAVYLYRKAPK